MTTPPPPQEPPFSQVGTATAEQPDFSRLGPSKRKRRKRRWLWLRRLIALAVLAGLLAGLGLGAGALARWAMPPAALNLGGAAPGEPMNILVIGVDPTPLPPDEMDKTTRRLADTVHVLNLDYRNHRAFVLTIPRDTRATLGRNGEGALGDALAIGGIPLVKDTVEELTGLSIHHYVWIDIDGAKELVKELGGGEEYFARPVKFKDPNTGLELDMAQGWHKLTPAQLLAFAYHRVPGGDLDRLARQQMLIQQWQEKAHGPWATFWFSGAAKRAMASLTTDLPKADFERLASEWRQVDPDDITYALLPGEVSSQGEWLMSPRRWETLLPRLQAKPGTKSVADLKPTIEILYADTAGDKVMNLAETLTKQGFQVVRTTNQPVSQEENVLMDRSGAEERSLPAQQAIDAAVKGVRMVADPGDVNGYGARYTLQLGKSYFR